MKEEIVNTSFADLVHSIQQVHDELAAQASRAVNVSLTLRNWLIGRHIAEYESKGENRVQYGETLLENLSSELKRLSVSACGRRELYRLEEGCYAYRDGRLFVRLAWIRCAQKCDCATAFRRFERCSRFVSSSRARRLVRVFASPLLG